MLVRFSINKLNLRLNIDKFNLGQYVNEYADTFNKCIWSFLSMCSFIQLSPCSDVNFYFQ